MKQHIAQKDLEYLASTHMAAEGAEGFAKKIEDTIKSVFPDSYIKAKYDTGLGDRAIFIHFAAGKDSKEWSDGIIQNDPLWHQIWIRGINSDGSLQDTLQMKLSTGGKIILSENDETGYRSKVVKIGWRNMKGTSDKLLDGLKKYFTKAKATLKEYKDRVREGEFIQDKV